MTGLNIIKYLLYTIKMGADCSNCRCTNRDEEKILIIDNADKHLIHHSKPDARKEKLESLEKSRGNLGSSANLGIE